MKHREEGIKELERYVNDLVAILALPAMWTGRDVARVASVLLDHLIRLLHLDLAYLYLKSHDTSSEEAWLHTANEHSEARISEMRERLSDYLKSGIVPAELSVPLELDIGAKRISVVPLGAHDQIGVVVAGASRRDFPTPREQLLLQVAANLAVIGLRESRAISERLRTARALESEVRSRDAELSAANRALTKEAAERLHAEERILRDERELNLLVDIVPQIIVVLEPGGDVRYVNRTGRHYLGDVLSSSEGVDLQLSAFCHPDDRVAVREAIEQAVSHVRPFEVETRIRGKGDSYRWFLFRFDPFTDEEEEVIRWYGSGLDIDNRKRAEERVREENAALREEISSGWMFEEIIGTSPPLQSLLEQASQVAGTDSTVLISGETGTGKELLARAIHKLSHRAGEAFVTVNCAAIPQGLIASELFGHERGAFTGAVQRRIGRFELAEGGTIFLDEIGDLPADAQVALLRVLQEREFERVGGNQPIRSDARVLTATHRRLDRAMEEGRFRPDLFYRLNVFPLSVPPLRDRGDDIPILVRHFVNRYSRQIGKRIDHIDDQSMELLRSYRWPGNVRELQNVIERSVILCEGTTLVVDERWFLRQLDPVSERPLTLSENLRAHELVLIEAALEESRGVVSGSSGAAARLGIAASTLESKIRALGIDKHRFK